MNYFESVIVREILWLKNFNIYIYIIFNVRESKQGWFQYYILNTPWQIMKYFLILSKFHSLPLTHNNISTLRYCKPESILPSDQNNILFIMVMSVISEPNKTIFELFLFLIKWFSKNAQGFKLINKLMCISYELQQNYQNKYTVSQWYVDRRSVYRWTQNMFFCKTFFVLCH